MSIYEKLYDFQQRIVDKFKMKSAFGLFLDMGLGKTPTSLALAEANNCTKVIIVTLNTKACEPVTLDGSWADWAAQSSLNYTWKAKGASDFDNTAHDALICNYESLFERGRNKKERVTLKRNLQEFIQSCRGHNVAILVDESHKIKNLQSLQTCAIMKLQKELKWVASKVYTYLLTGTPFTQGYIDLYAQLKLLGCTMTKGQFIDLYCVRGNVPGLLGWQQPIVGYKNLNGLFNLLHQYAITINSEDVADLPEKIFTYHTTKATDDFKMYTMEQAKLEQIADMCDRHHISYDIIVENETLKSRLKLGQKRKFNNPFYRDIDFPSSRWLAETSGQCWMRARQLSIGFNGNAEDCVWFDRSRLDSLKQFLERNEDNYLLFYNYTPELLEIFDICEELGYNIDVYCGEIKNLQHYERYASQSDEEKLTNKKNIILANFASGSTGLNWQEYNHCIIFSCPTLKDYLQGIKRIHRLGQKKTTFYHVFYQENWLDKGMNESLKNGVEYNDTMYEADRKRVELLTN